MTNETIARYQIQSEIGRGGMATVYLAHDPNFRRNVAIKLVASNLQAEHMYRERFEREAHLIAKIEHPAIVPVYDYGEHENKLYLVMRYMPGGSLAGRIKEGVLTLREAAQIISQIAPALDAVHSQGIIHRDLKPGNILFDGFGNPAISDFGIAHFTSATSDLTGSAIIGTPSYMSPEQVRGDANLDGRSDLYALGVILFEMLAGHGPFTSTTPLSVAFKHLTDPVPSIRLSRPDLPVELEGILTKALAKDRAMRYSTASELALELRAVAEKFPGSNKPALNRVRTSNTKDAVTEVDDEDSQPVPDLPSAALLEVPESSNPWQKSLASYPMPPSAIDRSSGAGKQVRPSSRKILPLLAIVGAGLLLFLLCGSLGLLGTWAGLILPGLFPAASQTLPPAPAATQASDVQDLILFADDFSDPNSGWPAGQNEQATYGYQPDGYHIYVNGIARAQWVYTDRVQEDASLRVDATPVIEEANGYHGLLCRIQDDNNFYYFVIQGNGDYTIGKYKNGEYNSFFGGWRQSDAILPGNQTNSVQADCMGNTLRLYVNNILVGEATDPDFTSGFSGILAATLEDQDFEVRFNNFLVTKPSQ